jgi:type I restriction enzyme, S subunit
MSFPRYPSYKDSGVAWLGEVPGHWSVQPFKQQIERNDGGVWGDDPDGVNDTIVLRSTEQTVDGHWKLDDPAHRKLSESEINGSLLAESDLLLTKSSGSSLHIGKTTLVTAEIAAMRCCYSNFMQRIRMKSTFLPKLAWHVMNNDLARLQFDLLSNSSTGLANLNATMVGQIVLPVASLPEQTQIAAFLDREAAKIDALVAEQRRLMELLKEKRQAVISHAVTKGLNPNAPMKPSGIEWLGDVPEHWEVTRIANQFREVAEAGTDDLPILSVSIHHGVSDKEMDEAELDRKVTRSDDRSKYKRVAADDLVYNMMRAWQGGFGAVTVSGMVSPAYVVARPKSRLVTAYVEHLLRTPKAIEQMRRHSRGITDFRLRLYWDEFKNLGISSPPLEEAQAICQEIDLMDERFDTLTTEAQNAIDLLQVRRTALISAAVTGQIDVRHLSGEIAD